MIINILFMSLTAFSGSSMPSFFLSSVLFLRSSWVGMQTIAFLLNPSKGLIFFFWADKYTLVWRTKQKNTKGSITNNAAKQERKGE